jgi:hypothetical protein
MQDHVHHGDTEITEKSKTVSVAGCAGKPGPRAKNSFDTDYTDYTVFLPSAEKRRARSRAVLTGSTGLNGFKRSERCPDGS